MSQHVLEEKIPELSAVLKNAAAEINLRLEAAAGPVAFSSAA